MKTNQNKKTWLDYAIQNLRETSELRRREKAMEVKEFFIEFGGYPVIMEDILGTYRMFSGGSGCIFFDKDIELLRLDQDVLVFDRRNRLEYIIPASIILNLQRASHFFKVTLGDVLENNVVYDHIPFQ